MPKAKHHSNEDTGTTVSVLGVAPAVALGQLYQSTSVALAHAAHDAEAARQRGEVVQLASTVQGVALLLGLDAATTARAVKKILNR